MPSRSPMKSGVVFLQYVTDEKIHQSRNLRRNMTDAESILWEWLRNRKIAGMKFRRQQVIEGFIADFYCEAAKLVIEVDGNVHDTKNQIEIDKHRREVFEARGLTELRFKNEEIHFDISKVIAKIKSFIE
jgi:very-short-patch-repair endonuclease